MFTIATGVQDSGNTTTQLIIIAILIIINAFFAASELAILSANPNKLKLKAEKKNKKAKLVLKLQEDETKLLSTIQVGITLAGFFSSATAAVSLSEGMAKVLESIDFPFASQIALIVVTLILSYFTLVLGELFPKRLALRNPEGIAMFVAKPISIIKLIFKPIVFVLSGSCTLLAKLFRVDKNVDDSVTEDEVIALVNEAVDDGVMLESEQKLIENVISFGDLLVKDVMKPRIDVFMININDTPSEIKKKLRMEKYTRVPVYEGNADNIIGIINIKDLFFELKANFTIDEFKSILREPYFVVEGMKARTLFNNLKRIQEHSAIIIDEVGSVSGYVTLEDLIEEITGDIFDEHDEIEKNIVKLDDCNYIVDATISIQDINKELNINLKRDFDYNSLAGYIQNKLEKIPTVDDEYYQEEDNIIFKIIELTNNRIKRIKITIQKNEENK